MIFPKENPAVCAAFSAFDLASATAFWRASFWDLVLSSTSKLMPPTLVAPAAVAASMTVFARSMARTFIVRLLDAWYPVILCGPPLKLYVGLMLYPLVWMSRFSTPVDFIAAATAFIFLLSWSWT